MTKPSETEKIISGSRIEKPFNLLEIDTTGKSISDLFRELNTRAREEFKKNCYRSNENYSRGQFSKSVFYKRFYFLRKHLREITNWLYKEDGIPKELELIMKEKVDYSNPWVTEDAIVKATENDFFGKT